MKYRALLVRGTRVYTQAVSRGVPMFLDRFYGKGAAKLAAQWACEVVNIRGSGFYGWNVVVE